MNIKLLGHVILDSECLLNKLIGIQETIIEKRKSNLINLLKNSKNSNDRNFNLTSMNEGILQRKLFNALEKDQHGTLI